jgi:hypothetical protein
MSEVEGVDRYAVAPPARPGIEAVESEGFGGGGVENLGGMCEINTGFQ